MHLCRFSFHLQMYKTLIWLIDPCQKSYRGLKTLINLLCCWNHIKEHDIHRLQYIYFVIVVYSLFSHTMYTEQLLILNFIYLLILDNFLPRGFITDPSR